MSEKLNIVKRKLSDLKHPETNVRMHPDKQIKELKRSIQKNGQTRLMVIDENNVIWIGNGMYQAMQELGIKEAQCLLKTGMSDVDKKKMMMSDNRIFDLGVDDMSAFDQLLKELGDDYDIPGYDEELLRTLTADTTDVDEMMSSYGIIDEDKKQEITQAKETYEKKDAEFAAKAEEIVPGSVSGAGQQSAPENNETPQESVSRRFLICPKCGERIWL